MRASQLKSIILEVDLNTTQTWNARKELRRKINEACMNSGSDESIDSFINSIANGNTQNLVLQELQSTTAMGRRMGIVFSKEDTLIMSKIIEADANRFTLLRRSNSN